MARSSPAHTPASQRPSFAAERAAQSVGSTPRRARGAAGGVARNAASRSASLMLPAAQHLGVFGPAHPTVRR